MYLKKISISQGGDVCIDHPKKGFIIILYKMQPQNGKINKSSNSSKKNY